jgi:O-antigen/teichoic acid export membrane protein
MASPPASRFLKESAIYAIGALFGQGITFVLFPFLAHVFSPHDYGVIDILALTATLVNFTVALEINQGLAREASGLEDRALWRVYASTALIFTLVMYSIFAVVAMTLAVPITHVLLDHHTSPWIVRVEIVVIWVNGVVYVAQDQLRWHKRAGAYVATSIAVVMGTTITTGVLVLVFGVGVIGALIGQLVGGLCAGLLLFALSRTDYRWCFDREKCRHMLSYSLPLVLSSIGVFLNSFGDRLAIQHSRSLSAVGVYGVGFRIAAVVSLLLLGFQGSTTPMVFSRHRDPSTRIELARIFRFFSAVGLVVFVALSVFADSEVRLLAARSYAGADVVVPYLVLQAILFGAYVFAPGLAIAKRTRVIAVISVSAGVINLGLAFALVPSLGIRGAGIATLVSSAWFFAWNMAYSQRAYPVPHRWGRLACALGAALAVVIVVRSLLPQGGDHALALGRLLVKGGATLGAAVVIVALLVGRQELIALYRQLSPIVSRALLGSLIRARDSRRAIPRVGRN